ncbi:MAG: tRNA (adenosine(37)-N6)-threonylcarbamoyltransferase complex ATPase subunit type 1 TsaE [Actinomycetota bacterium]|nr:tRNA (adenosine(37)-N6)-threonylcarbamoyltransferase complex ATPase subunit type 1 TsaE [Actinomycetota bacterium]
MCSRHETSDPGQTEALGATLARGLRPGDAVLLEGELGAGKTTFVRGACRALGVSAPITSPTFTIGQLYSGSAPVAHVDLFRLDHVDGEDLELLGDYLGPDTIAFVEWPRDVDALRGFAWIAARVTIEHAGGNRRIVTVEADENPGA